MPLGVRARDGGWRSTRSTRTLRVPCPPAVPPLPRRWAAAPAAARGRSAAYRHGFRSRLRSRLPNCIVWRVVRQTDADTFCVTFYMYVHTPRDAKRHARQGPPLSSDEPTQVTALAAWAARRAMAAGGAVANLAARRPGRRRDSGLLGGASAVGRLSAFSVRVPLAAAGGAAAGGTAAGASSFSRALARSLPLVCFDLGTLNHMCAACAGGTACWERRPEPTAAGGQ